VIGNDRAHARELGRTDRAPENGDDEPVLALRSKPVVEGFSGDGREPHIQAKSLGLPD